MDSIPNLGRSFKGLLNVCIFPSLFPDGRPSRVEQEAFVTSGVNTAFGAAPVGGARANGAGVMLGLLIRE